MVVIAVVYLHLGFAVCRAMTTMTTIGYGDRTPQLRAEIVFTIIAELLGISVFALLLYQIGKLHRVSSRTPSQLQTVRTRRSQAFAQHKNGTAQQQKTINARPRVQVMEESDHDLNTSKNALLAYLRQNSISKNLQMRSMYAPSFFLQSSTVLILFDTASFARLVAILC